MKFASKPSIFLSLFFIFSSNISLFSQEDIDTEYRGKHDGHTCKPCGCKPASCDEACFKDDVGILGTLLVNKINPVYSDGCDNCFMDPRPGAVTCFSGTLAVEPCPGKKLLVNEVCPVAFDTETGRCVENESGTTVFSGNVKFEKGLDLTEGQTVIGTKRIFGQRALGAISGTTNVLKILFAGSSMPSAYVRLIVTGTWTNNPLIGMPMTKPIGYVGEFIITRDGAFSFSEQTRGFAPNALELSITPAAEPIIKLSVDQPLSSGKFNGGVLYYEIVGQFLDQVIDV